MKYDWYVFDLDGTLTKSEEGIINSAKFALNELGAPCPSDAELRKFIGPPLLWSFETVAGLDPAAARRAVDIDNARYAQVGWQENGVYTGIPHFLRGIKRRGGHLAVASAKPEKFVMRIMEFFGLEPYFDRIVGAHSDEEMDKKELIMSALPEDVDPSRAVMVGDREYDIDGALRAGITPVAAGYGYGAPGEFAGAAHVAGSVDELWEILTGEKKDRGFFVTFEGGDGCGKSTQFGMAAEYFARRGWDVVTSREPGGCYISEKIRELLLDTASEGMTPKCEAMLYAAAREQHVSQVILPALESGKLFLCDRFLDSSIAYQAYGRELTEDFIRQINKPAVGGLAPDLTLLYVVDAETARKRVMSGGAPDRIESEGGAFVARLNRGYAILAEREKERIRTLDAARPIDAVFADTSRHITELLN
jgi:dTMP kinase